MSNLENLNILFVGRYTNFLYFEAAVNFLIYFVGPMLSYCTDVSFGTNAQCGIMVEAGRFDNDVRRQKSDFYVAVNDSANCFPLIHSYVADKCVRCR